MADALERRADVLVAALGATLACAAAALWLNQSLAFAWSISLILTLAIALGAGHRGVLGPFRWYLGAALVAWGGAFTLMHWLPADTQTLILGLPPATAVSVLVLWPAPLLLVTLPYALHFERHVFTEEDWQALEAGHGEQG